MPSNILQADVGFPELTEEQTTDEKFQLVTNYLFMLREQLRYSLSNLDTNNFSTGGIDGLTKLITEPIYAQLEDEDGNFAAITAMADGLGVRIGNAEGQLTQLTATVDGLNTTVSGDNGLVSKMTQTAAAMNLLLTNGISSTSVSLTSSMLAAVANGITLSAGKSGANSTISLTAGGVTVTTPGSIKLDATQVTTGSIAAERIQTAAVSIIGNTVTAAYVNALGISCQYLRLNGNDEKNYMEVTSTGFTLTNNNTTRAIMSYSGNTVGLRLGNTEPFAFFQKFYSSSSLYGAWMGNADYSTGVMADLKNNRVRIKVGTDGRYWLFKTSGIDYCDEHGNVLNSVQLTS